MEEFAEHLLPVTHPLHQLVERSVDLLVQKNKDILEVSQVPWSVHVVESPQINAFVLPVSKTDKTTFFLPFFFYFSIAKQHMTQTLSVFLCVEWESVHVYRDVGVYRRC